MRHKHNKFVTSLCNFDVLYCIALFETTAAADKRSEVVTKSQI